MAIALDQAGLRVRTEVPIRVEFRGICVGDYRADLIVEDCVVVEVKAVATLLQSHDMQLVNYLKATGIAVGLLFNFGPKAEFRRKVLSSKATSA